MDFIAIDVETANSDMASICQVGVVSYRDGRVVDSWSSLIDPETHFDGWNVSIHGIDKETVRGAPTFPQVFAQLQTRLSGQTVACHTHFDRSAVRRAIEQYDLGQISCDWLDTAMVARRAWRGDEAIESYGLKSLADHLGIEFNHHDALEDARAAGEVLLRAIKHTGLDVENWKSRVRMRIDGSSSSSKVTREGNPDGPLHGEVAVFTGALVWLTRSDAADLAAKVGCAVAENVTKKTTVLVVGDQDIRILAGHDRSRKHRRAEELRAKGQAIRIIGESDFQRLVDFVDSEPKAPDPEAPIDEEARNLRTGST